MISAGYELRNVLAAWEGALGEVPDGYLSRAYDRAAANWDWLDVKRSFSPDVVKQAYVALVVEDRQRAEAERRNAARRNPETYRCWHCSDLGFQQIFVWERDRWYSAVRPCCCESAPASQRRESPLEEPGYIRNRLGQYVKRAHLVKFGAPNNAFESFTFAAKGESDANSANPGQA